jgi:DNA polymerase III alpha subunit
MKSRRFAKSTKTQIVAAHDVYYLDPEDRQARNTLMSIQNGGDASERSFEDSKKIFLLFRLKKPKNISRISQKHWKIR